MSSRGRHERGIERAHGKGGVLRDDCGRERCALHERDYGQGHGIESMTSVSARHRLLVASKLREFGKESFGEMGGHGVVRGTAPASEQKVASFSNRSFDYRNAEDCGQMVKPFPEDARRRVVQPGNTKHDEVRPVHPERMEQMMIERAPLNLAGIGWSELPSGKAPRSQSLAVDDRLAWKLRSRNHRENTAGISRRDSGEHDGTYPPLPLTDCAAFRKVRTPPPREGGWQSKPGPSGRLPASPVDSEDQNSPHSSFHMGAAR